MPPSWKGAGRSNPVKPYPYRDEEVAYHNKAAGIQLAATLTTPPVLRADKRGVGKSTGDIEAATITDFATDAEAGVAYLKTRTEVDSHRIGLVGHSEGPS